MDDWSFLIALAIAVALVVWIAQIGWQELTLQ